MSLKASDGSTLSAHVRPLLGWEVMRGRQLARVQGNMEYVLGTLEDDLFPGAIIPAVMNRELHYYAVAPTHAQQQRLLALLRASVGRTITDFSGELVYFDAAYELEALLTEHGYPSGFRFSNRSDARRGRYALTALARLRHLVNQSGSLTANQPRTTGQELRRFEMSLVAYDKRGAEQAIQFLQSNMRLDAVNLGAMSVRLLSRFQEWEQICQLDIFPSLCQARRTGKITDLLAEAAYRTFILDLENKGDPSQLVAAFNDRILPKAGNLFATCPDYVSPMAGRAFLLAAAASGLPETELIDELRTISDHWPEEDRNSFEYLRQHFFQESAGPKVADDSPESDYQFQIDMLQSRESIPNLERARAGVFAASQLDTTEAFRIAIAYVDSLEEEDRNTLLSNSFNRLAYQRMAELTAGTFTPENWVEWIRALEREDLYVPQDFFLTALESWRVSEHLEDGRRVSELVDAIESAVPVPEDRLLDVLPALVQWLQSDPGCPDSSLRELYRAIYNRILLHLTVRWSKETASVAGVLLEALLELGADREDYDQLLDDMGDALPTESGRTDAEVFLELAETIADYGSPSPESRLRLWVRIVEGLRSIGTRLSEHEVVLANDIGQVFGFDEAVPTAQEIAPATAVTGDLAGKMVAVYTLTESVSRRTGRILQKLYPGIRVELASDTVGSRRLEELARRADIFVVCWRSATHAATELIKRHRPTGAATIYPTGNGSSSILRELQENYSP
ncbi:MAG: protein DpdD [Chloroflexota bacterium]|nr:protein DpdD [Chloroflexota bacterium]